MKKAKAQKAPCTLLVTPCIVYSLYTIIFYGLLMIIIFLGGLLNEVWGFGNP